MIRALYTAASAMLFGMRQQDIAADNLANSATSGYKAATSAGTAFSGVLARRVDAAQAPVPLLLDEVLGRIGTGVYQSVRSNDFADGALRNTGLRLDLALSGPGFFVIDTPAGPQYTRDGHFGRDASNVLVTAQGLAVLGSDGAPITLENDHVRVTAAGEVLVDDKPVATLQIVDIDRANALRAGGSRFALAAGEAAPLTPGSGTTVRQGMLEEANVDAARAATQVLSISRAFEASQRIFTTINDTLQATVNEVGRVARQ